MVKVLAPELKRALASRLAYYREMGIYDLYRREGAAMSLDAAAARGVDSSNPTEILLQPEQREEMSPRKSVAVAQAPPESMFEVLMPRPETGVADPVVALKLIREDLGDCTRCRLAKQGRKQIVFGVGSPGAELMFIGEAPGADEDQQGEPFVGRAGQLLTNMIAAMGLKREQVYIANIIKCRPPNNRTPERDECETCSPFLMRQIATIQPKVIVALGAVAARTLLAINDSMSNLRGRWYEFAPTGVRSNDPSWTGAKLAVTYHPAFLLRDPRQKKEAWKDLQMVMKELGLKPPAKAAE
ncbi:MAG TPA: uracil-DNA glycosylase [Terriglobales bacterium]|nr:uracil-DNA glycosylase [Terriglobales bacterium]